MEGKHTPFDIEGAELTIERKKKVRSKIKFEPSDYDDGGHKTATVSHAQKANVWWQSRQLSFEGEARPSLGKSALSDPNESILDSVGNTMGRVRASISNIADMLKSNN